MSVRRTLGLALVLLLGCAEAEQAGVYDARTYGAVPDDGLDDTPGLQLAISRAGAQGGGIVGLARGRYHIAGSVELGLANGVTLQGSGVDLLVSGVQFEEIQGVCLHIRTGLNAVSALLTGSTFSLCHGGVDVRADAGANRFIANGNRGSGAIRCAAPLPPGAANFFYGGASGC